MCRKQPYRSPSERSGKGCCGQWFAGPPLRAVIFVVALGGLACALGGAALGATGLAGPPTSHFTAALLMTGKCAQCVVLHSSIIVVLSIYFAVTFCVVFGMAEIPMPEVMLPVSHGPIHMQIWWGRVQEGWWKQDWWNVPIQKQTSPPHHCVVFMAIPGRMLATQKRRLHNGRLLCTHTQNGKNGKSRNIYVWYTVEFWGKTNMCM